MSAAAFVSAVVSREYKREEEDREIDRCFGDLDLDRDSLEDMRAKMMHWSKEDVSRLFYAVLNNTVKERLLEVCVAEDVTAIVPLMGEKQGKREVCEVMRRWKETFNPYYITPHLMSGPMSRQMTAVWHSRGKFVKDFHRTQATHKFVRIHGVTVLTFNEQNQIVHWHSHFDGHELLRQLKPESQE
eukprot:TRINITY_DN2916_c0_g1_i7.p2 TRINITY_DN2916_c0_g1~~TRINITY_DN2916_c0_g1_i7.p2  ORF type:complete len:186 (+),score=73.04 TRINITY_DN2916_c0_g1_i7:170-727(+)